MFFLTSGDSKPPKSLNLFEFLISILGKTLPVEKKSTLEFIASKCSVDSFFPSPTHHRANFGNLDTVNEGDNLINFTNEKQYFFS
jgi:hypothetical protein